MHWDAKKLFQILPSYNTFIERPEIKKPSNVELLKELPFYNELKSDPHVPENFCQIKIFPSHVRKNAMICLLGV